jgi:hypothetical protein
MLLSKGIFLMSQHRDKRSAAALLRRHAGLSPSKAGERAIARVTWDDEADDCYEG